MDDDETIMIITIIINYRTTTSHHPHFRAGNCFLVINYAKGGWDEQFWKKSNPLSKKMSGEDELLISTNFLLLQLEDVEL